MHKHHVEKKGRSGKVTSGTTFTVGYSWLFDVVIVGILPTFFIFLAPIQRFLPAGWVDPALYLGLSMDYGHIVTVYGWDYHSLRVSFLLPNAIANIILPPVYARLVIVFAFYFLGLVALYGGARILWGRIPAAIAVSFLAYNPIYLLANTAGYVDGSYIAYTFCVFFALAGWSAWRHVVWLAAAGVFATLAVLAHALAAAPVGLVILFFLIVKWEEFIRKPITFVSGGLIGGLLAWAFFVAALYKMGFGISAFYQLSWIVNASLTGFGAKYRFDVMDWLPFATRLAPGVIVSLTLLFLLVSGGRRALRRVDVAALLISVASAALLPAYDISFGGSTTQSAFYAGLAASGTGIGVAAMAAMFVPATGRVGWMVSATITVALLALNWFSTGIVKGVAASGLPADLFTLVACGGAISVLLLTPLRGMLIFRAAALGILLLICGFSLVANRDTRQLYKEANIIDNEEYFRGAVFVRNLLNSDILPGRVPLFWYERDEFSARDGRSRELARKLRFGDTEMELTYYDTLASLRLWHRSFFLTELKPQQSLESLPFLMDPNVTVVVIEQDNAKLDAAIGTLRNAGVSCHVGKTSTYHSKSFDMNITLIELLGQGNRTPASCGRA